MAVAPSPTPARDIAAANSSGPASWKGSGASGSRSSCAQSRGGGAGGGGYNSRPMVAPLQPDPEKLAAIRAALPATGAGIYLNTGTSGPLPAATVSAMRELEDWEERVGRGGPAGWGGLLERMGGWRRGVAGRPP